MGGVQLKTRAASWEQRSPSKDERLSFSRPSSAKGRPQVSGSATLQAAHMRRRPQFVVLATIISLSTLLLLGLAGHSGMLMNLPTPVSDITIVPMDAAEQARWQAVIAKFASRDGSFANVTIEIQLLQQQDDLTRQAPREQRIAARILGPSFGGAVLAKPLLSPPPRGPVQLKPSAALADYNRIMQAPHGRCPRVNSTLSMPLGVPGASNVLCHPLLNSSVQSIAIVGNGPLSQEDRRSIEQCDLVIRFNLMNNWRRYQEKVDIWVARYSSEASQRYWGFTNFRKPDAEHVVDSLQAAWLVGGNQTDADYLLEQYPALADKPTVLIVQEPLNLQYAHSLEDEKAAPSTGFIAILAALHCSSPSSRLHLYGMNWSNGMWSGHKGPAEKGFVQAMERRQRVRVHATACSGMRECGQAEIHNSCHWDNWGHYMCLLEQKDKGRQWTDMTYKVPGSRKQEFDGS